MFIIISTINTMQDKIAVKARIKLDIRPYMDTAHFIVFK